MMMYFKKDWDLNALLLDIIHDKILWSHVIHVTNTN